MTQPLHVLLVDPRPDEHDSLELRLKRTGYRTTLAADHERAIETARRDPPDLIVLDDGATDLDPAAACRELKRVRPELPVLLYTRREPANSTQTACDADDVVARPADPALVMQKIVQLLGR